MDKLTMPRQRHLYPRQPPLRMRLPEHPGPRQRTQAYLAVVRDEELLRRLLLEPLQAAPRHVLDHQQRAVGNEYHVERPVADDGPI